MFVCVDKETRKTCSPPQWWSDKFRPLSKNPEKSPLQLSPLKLPPTASFTHPLLVSALDMDYYGHANNTAYIRFGMDSVYGAYKSGALQGNINEDYAGARINTMELVYLQDCKMGDKLTGRVWAEGANVHCIVQDEQGKDLYHQTMVVDMPHASPL